jgi:hypothetical protein
MMSGAAAGLGLWEAVLVLSLGPQFDVEGALLMALTAPGSHHLGDLLFFGISCVNPAYIEAEVRRDRLPKLIGHDRACRLATLTHLIPSNCNNSVATIGMPFFDIYDL